MTTFRAMWHQVQKKIGLLSPPLFQKGFFHDHLFIPDGTEERVMEVLEELVLSAGREAIVTSSSGSSFNNEDTPCCANSDRENV